MKVELSREAILVRPSIGQAGLSARSRILSEEAASQHGAEQDRIAGVVQILRPRDRKGITKAINRIRSVIEFNTAPWEDGGYRLCPLANYDSMRREVAENEEVFESELQDLVARRDELATAYRKEVGAELASEHPFPSKEELAANFRFKLSELPLPNPAQIYLNHLSDAQKEAMKERVIADMNEKLEIGSKEIIQRLTKQVEKIKAQCAKTEDTRWHKSLIQNAENLVDVLTKLNITNSPEINRLIGRVKDELTLLKIEDLKDNEKVRANTVKTANSILKDIKGFKTK